MFTQEFTLIRFEDRFAILQNDLTGEIKWPIKNLPDSINPGDLVKLKLITDKTEENEKYIAMKKVLEELVN